MSRRAVNHPFQYLSAFRNLLPAWCLFALVMVIDHPLSLILLLLGNAIAMTAICNALGFGLESSFWRSIARHGLSYFVLSSAYIATVAALLAGPAWWVARDGSLVSALLLSATLAAALFLAWRVWPAFALPFVWDDAYPCGDERGSWLSCALRRCLAFARHLTTEHDLFLAYGLPANASLLLLNAVALAIAGVGGLLAGEIRIVAIAIYALILVPLLHGVLVNRCLRALMARAHDRADTESSEQAALIESTGDERSVLPDSISRSELDATLLCAAHSGQVALALAALDRGADPDASPGQDLRDQRSPMMIAVALPDTRLLRALIAKGADVNRTCGGSTPLIAATRDSYRGRPEAVTTLLANGADARIADAAGNAPLHHASRSDEPIVAALLVDAGAELNAINADGASALGIACSHANWDVAAFLIDRGANVELDRAHPALVAAASGSDDDPAGVRMLLKHRAHVDIRAPLERTALMAAALAGHSRIVETLLAAGASPDLVDHRGTTALMEAARFGAVAAIHSLGKRKADPDLTDASGRTALIIACQSRHASEDAVRALLGLGADRTRAGADGKRALEHAAAAGRWHIVALLDPAYPLPSSLDRDSPPLHTASTDHLLDALRFGHWNVAAEFVGVLKDWPANALVDLYFELSDPDHVLARTWLMNHGMDGATLLSDGRSLTDALVEGLPDTCAALREVMDRGISVCGAGTIARLLGHAQPHEPFDPLRSVAWDALQRGGDWCAGASADRTALHIACALGDVAFAIQLIERGADPNARDALGRTPLHLALNVSSPSALELVQLLLRAGANPEIATANGETALGFALASTQLEFARWLNWPVWKLPLRALRASDLPSAAAQGDIEAVDRLLLLGFPAEAEDAQGATALIRASGSGHTSLVVRLLAAGADPNHVARSGMHCLAAAVNAKQEGVVRTLLSHGIAADTRLAGGGTPLILAAALGQMRIAEALLEAGADANAVDDQGTAPLHAASQHAFESRDTPGSRSLLELLLRCGARLDGRNARGQDALLLLLGARAQPGTRCDAEHLLRLAEFLLERGARVDAQDQRGVSALHACALHGLYGCARLLKAHGAPLDLVDGFDRSAADVAGLLGYVDVAAELGNVRHSSLPTARQTLRRPARAPD
ncbi:MAG: ankyrin repeat domain-containing protein [Dokdonella sp.]|uniref:ankyrin repeat domain-containing protein n=1 Tax=Dokdonella sp. TaxID=2291710 RepID=UPI003266B597